MVDSLLWRKKFEQFFDDNGAILALGYFEYRDHDTNDLVTVYKDAALTITHAAQIALSAAGRLADPIYLPTGTYKEALFDADDNELFNKNGYPGAVAVVASSGSFTPLRKTYSSNQVIPSGDDGYMIDVSTSGSQLTMTLPQLSAISNGWHAWFRLTGATGSALLQAQGSDTINGVASVALLAQYEWALIVKGTSNFAALFGSSPSGAADRPLVEIKDRDLATPPGSPAVAASYLVAASPTGAWTGHANDVATWTGSAWVFLAPTEGLHLWVSDEDIDIVWNGTAYQTPNPDAGTIVQTATASYATYSSHTATIPEDDTTPLSTEGDQIMSASITPKNTTNLIRGHISVPILGATASHKTIVAVFRGTTCIAVGMAIDLTNNEVLAITFADSPGSVAAQTYSVRIGTNGTGTTYVNGSTSARLFGGAQKATMNLHEVVA